MTDTLLHTRSYTMDSDTLDTNYDMDKLKSDMLDTDTLLNTRSYTMDSDTLDTNLLDTDT